MASRGTAPAPGPAHGFYSDSALSDTRSYPASAPPSAVAFIAILFLACLLRVVWLVLSPQVINGEGAEYARIAQNLLSGQGYVGIALEGRELMFPPMYPLLIAVASIFVPDFLVAAQLVSLVAGVALLLPVFGLVRDLYGERAATVATLLAACHPVLIYLSASTWVEGLYITLITASLYYVNRCQQYGGTRYWLSSGIFLALAYLTCPQAIVFPAVFLILLLVLRPSRDSWRKAAVLAASFGVLALPYIVFLSLSAGQFRVEGKTIANNVLGQRLLSGVPHLVAAYEVTDSLEEKGVWMRPHADIARSSKGMSYKTTLSIVVSAGVANLKQVFLAVSLHPLFGAPLLIPLATLGLFRSPWTRERARGELVLAAALLGAVLPMTTIIHQFAGRYYYVLVPFFIVWSAQGIIELSLFLQGTLARLEVRRLSPDLAAPIVRAIACLGLIAVFVLGAPYVIHDDRTAALSRGAGEWLAGIPGEKVLMDTDTVTAFHAAAKYVPMPWSNSHTALRYANKRGVNFIVVKSWAAASRPYLPEWLGAGVPAAHVSLVHTLADGTDDRILIFQVSGDAVAERRSPPVQ